MGSAPKRWGKALLWSSITALTVASQMPGWGQSAPATGSAAPVARALGTIKTIAENVLTIASDSGAEITATLTPASKILRVPPGEKDLKNATPMQVADLQPGDRVLVRGQGSADGRSIAALSVIVMKQSDVSAKQERDREDWQKRGVGGLVNAVDPVAGTVIISAAGFGGSHKVTVRTAKDTILRRYAPGSVKFDEARPAPLDQIKPGDQLRARGMHNADRTEITAQEIVSGTFRSISGTITALDPAANSVTVHDVLAKASVVVKLSPDSQIKKLPTEMAQRIAMRLKAGNGEGAASSPSGQGTESAGGNQPASSDAQFQHGRGGMQSGVNGPPDFQRFLGRLPNSKLSDLQKGDAVMIVATADGNAASVTAITLLAGVEPILTASPTRDAAMMLSPWTLGGSSAEAEGGPQ